MAALKITNSNFSKEVLEGNRTFRFLGSLVRSLSYGRSHY